jgi:hypothetical protein
MFFFPKAFVLAAIGLFTCLIKIADISKFYLFLAHSQAAVPDGSFSNSTTSPSATISRKQKMQLLKCGKYKTN